MATNARNPPPAPASNGIITGPAKGAVGGNRKKQKRRAKQAAKAGAQPMSPTPLSDQQAEPDYDEDPLGYAEEEYDDEYSDAEPQQYHHQYAPPHTNGHSHGMPPPAMTSKRNKKKRTNTAGHHDMYNPALLGSGMSSLPTPPPPPIGTSAATLRSMQRSVANANIWNTSTQQERQNIKNFWLSLSEEDRKSLLKIEKEAVLRKMKQQQKHSCSCTVCGRKRTAIEEELEVLYEGYYEELETYAHHDHPPLPATDGMLPEPLQHRRTPHPLAAPPPTQQPHHRSSQMLEHLDEQDEMSSQESEEYSEEEEEYSDEEDVEPPRGPVPDFFNFGQNLTVKDNLLTVADDLLKNDGRKFIEMMEQLAERRMQRESEAEYAAANPSHPGSYPSGDQSYNHEDPLAAGDEYDDDEASYDSQEEYDDDLDEEDDMGGLTEEQRMQEGRRMFQIFAARMFEQRVLNAYKEKVAKERQEQLLNELQEETKLEKQREEKKKREAEKKKEKKRQQQQAKAEEKAKKEAEKAAEEARLKELEEKKLEEQRKKKEQQRLKKEEEKRKQEEERQRKEAEKQRRTLEEQQRREEAEKKQREQKAAEKARKEEARKREREGREAREREARERKVQEDKEKKERESKAKADWEAKEREKTAQQAAQPPQPQPPQIVKRPSQAGLVAVPGSQPRQTPSGISSPFPAVATPAVPKAPTPAKQRQTSQQGSHATSPKQAQSQTSSAPSKSSSPSSVSAQQQQNAAPKTIMQKPVPHQQQGPHPPHPIHSPLHQQQMQPPPGMPHPQHHPGNFGGMPPMGFHGYQGPQAPMMHNMGPRGPIPGMYGHQGPPMGIPNRMSPYGPPGMSGPPPGMMQPNGRGMGFPFDNHGVNAPPGFGPQPPQQNNSHTSPIGIPPANAAPGSDLPRPSLASHSRQQSASDKERFEAAANQPIARPAPIQRPSSVKPQGDRGSNGDVDDLSKHLGSSALLDDSDEPIPQGDSRRMSAAPGPNRNGPLGISGFGPPTGGFGTPSSNWNTPSLPFGQGPGLGQQQWGSLPSSSPMSGWAANNAAFAANGFGAIGGGPGQMPMPMHRPSIASRPLAIRLAVCQACKQLASSPNAADGFHDIQTLFRQIDAQRPHMLESPPTLKELDEICETEGDSQNGGGELSVRKSGNGDVMAVKWSPGSGTPEHQGRGSNGAGSLGEIGSPMPSKTSPAGVGFGAAGMGRAGGFASLGAVGSPGF